jgi:hypothetical protein
MVSEEVLEMWWLPLALLIVLFPIGIYLVRPQKESAPDGPRKPASAAPVARPESLEGTLTAQLASGEITRRQYVRAMEQLAARDEERHPLSVPPEVGDAR